jgi:CrcB protein
LKWDVVYVIVGAVAGALIRYRITGSSLFLGSLPVSVLIVNVVGSLILGATSTAVTSLGLDQRYTLLIGIGFCGTLTTMSSFAFESASLITIGKLLLAGIDIVANVGASILAIFLGRALVLLLVQ